MRQPACPASLGWCSAAPRTRPAPLLRPPVALAARRDGASRADHRGQHRPCQAAHAAGPWPGSGEAAVVAGAAWCAAAGDTGDTGRSGSACSRHWVPDDMSGLAVRWDVRVRLSDADVVDLRAERGARGRIVNRSTVSRWATAEVSPQRQGHVAAKTRLIAGASWALPHRLAVASRGAFPWRRMERFAVTRHRHRRCARARTTCPHSSNRTGTSPAPASRSSHPGQPTVAPSDDVSSWCRGCFPVALRIG